MQVLQGVLKPVSWQSQTLLACSSGAQVPHTANSILLHLGGIFDADTAWSHTLPTSTPAGSPAFYADLLGTKRSPFLPPSHKPALPVVHCLQRKYCLHSGLERTDCLLGWVGKHVAAGIPPTRALLYHDHHVHGVAGSCLQFLQAALAVQHLVCNSGRCRSDLVAASTERPPNKNVLNPCTEWQGA
eukprot:1160056-Pelagomonas_calceolata.AAC.4